MTPEYTTVDGVRIRYRMQRRQGAPKLLLINSLPQSIRCWDAHWEELATTFELLAIDMPGFGLSESRPDSVLHAGPPAVLCVLAREDIVIADETAALVEEPRRHS